MMTAPILRTKLYLPPARPEFVPRPHLVRWLDTGLRHKLILITAQAVHDALCFLLEHQPCNLQLRISRLILATTPVICLLYTSDAAATPYV